MLKLHTSRLKRHTRQKQTKNVKTKKKKNKTQKMYLLEQEKRNTKQEKPFKI